MKKITALLLTGIILFAACGGEPDFEPVPRNRAPAETEEEVPVVLPPEPEPEPEIIPEEPEEPAPLFISVEEAEQAARDAIDPNGEFDYRLEYNGSRPGEIDGVHYYMFYWYFPRGGKFRDMLFVDRLTGDVFLDTGRLLAFPFDETTELIYFVQNFNGADFNLIPAFNDINEIPLEYFIRLHGYINYDFEYTEEQIDELNADFERQWFYRAHGVYPSRIEAYIRENYNINFNINHYDFNVINNDNDKNEWSIKYYPGLWASVGLSVVWDEEAGAFIYIINNGLSGGNGTFCRVFKIEQDGDKFYVIAADMRVSEYVVFVEGYFLHTVRRNENGDFNIMSKQVIDVNEISFTEEELDEIKSWSWIGEAIIVEGRFAMTRLEIDEIIEKVLEDVDSDEELDWWRPELTDGYYSTSVYYTVPNDRDRVDLIYIGRITINALTGEAHFEPYESP
jgi:hypothetical protein